MTDDVIRFPCEECGKLIGAHPAMVEVQCSRCKLLNEVPARRAAQESLSQPVRLVSVDVPFRLCLRLGLKLAIASIPFLILVTAAACFVLWLAWLLFTPATPTVLPVPPALPETELVQ